MGLKRLRLRNYRCFEATDLDFGQFNVIVGANASGKSTLMSALRFVRDVSRYDLENAVSMQGGFEYMVGLGSEAGTPVEIEVELEGGLESGHLLRRSDTQFLIVDPLSARYRLRLDPYKTNYRRFRVGFEEIEQRVNLRLLDPTDPRRGWDSGAVVAEGIQGVRREGRILQPYEDFSQSVSADADWNEVPWRGRSRIRDDSSLLGRAYGPATRLAYDLRQALEGFGFYDIDSKLPKSATPVTGKSDLEEDGSNLAIALQAIGRTKKSSERLTELIQCLLPFIDGFDVAHSIDRSLFFTVNESFYPQKRLPGSLVSDGTANVFALLVALFFGEKTTVLLEEPERNIHPALLSRFVDLLRDAATQRQIIVTTHNPEFLNGCSVDELMLVSRDSEGASRVSRPGGSPEVKSFLEHSLGLGELYVQNLLDW